MSTSFLPSFLDWLHADDEHPSFVVHPRAMPTRTKSKHRRTLKTVRSRFFRLGWGWNASLMTRACRMGISLSVRQLAAPRMVASWSRRTDGGHQITGQESYEKGPLCSRPDHVSRINVESTRDCGLDSIAAALGRSLRHVTTPDDLDICYC